VSSIFPRNAAEPLPTWVRGRGSRVWTKDGTVLWDAVSGGACTANLGHGCPPLIAAAIARQLEELSYVYADVATNPRREQLAEVIASAAPPGFGKVWFATDGSSANEAAIRAARAYHVRNGEPHRAVIVGAGLGYNGATFGLLGVQGRESLRADYGDYIVAQESIPPCTSWDDPAGDRALAVLDRLLAKHPGQVSAVLLEPVTAVAFPGHAWPPQFWAGLDKRRREHGFLVILDCIVTGMGRCGGWFTPAGQPVKADIMTFGKGLSAGFIPISGMIVTDAAHDVISRGPFSLGHTFDANPLACAAALAVIRHLTEYDLLRAAVVTGGELRDELTRALAASDMVYQVRGVGSLIGVEYRDPRDPDRLLPPEMRVHERIDQTALRRHHLIVRGGNPRVFGAGGHTTIAVRLNSSGGDRAQITERFAATVADVEAGVKAELGRRSW
jgi:adenosylmethionine-8-amino-7-oxononanoate aminotransferase